MITQAQARRILTGAAAGQFAAAVLEVLRDFGRDGHWLMVADTAKLAQLSVRSLQRRLSA